MFLLFETGLACSQDNLSVQCLVIFYFEFKLQVYKLSLQSSKIRDYLETPLTPDCLHLKNKMDNAVDVLRKLMLLIF